MLDLIRRGVDSALNGVTPEQFAQLQVDAQAYENAGPDMEVNHAKMIPVIVTGALFMVTFFLVCVDFTFCS